MNKTQQAWACYSSVISVYSYMQEDMLHAKFNEYER